MRIYAGLPGVELVGVVDIDDRAAYKIARKFGTTPYRSLGEIPEGIDAVSIAVPTTAHAEVAIPFLRRGVAVLLEKPISARLDEARAIIDAAAQGNAVLQIGHLERFNPALLKLSDSIIHPMFIEAHRISPFKVRGTDVDVVLDIMIHDIDIILTIVASPLVEIQAVGIPVLSRSEDIANARLRVENGCIANVTASRISFEKVRKIRVFQSNAYLSLDYQNQEGMIYRKDGGGIVREKLPLEKDEPLKLEIVSFLDCVRASREPLVPGEQGRQALRVASEITRLCRENPLYKAAIEEQRTSPPIDLGQLR